MSDYARPPFQPAGGAKPKRTGRACLIAALCGCGGVILLGLIIVGVVYFGAKRFIGRMVDEYTDTKPITMPQVQIAPDGLRALKERMDNFQKAVEAGTGVEPLTLTGDDINAIIQNEPSWKDLKDKVYISIEGNQIRGQVSFPVGEAFPALKGRYLNGSAAFKVALNNGMLFAFVESVEVKDKAFPEQFMGELRKNNLIDGLRDNPEAWAKIQSLTEKLDRIEVKDGVITVVPRAGGMASEQPQAEISGLLDKEPAGQGATQ